MNFIRSDKNTRSGTKKSFVTPSRLVVTALVFALGTFSIGIETSSAAPKRKPVIEVPDANGRLRLVVSLDEQEIDVYRGKTLIDTSPISSGKKGLETPMGVYSILQKNRHHRSNIYSNAPMPYMQRITWSGIALHEGRLPGYAASHGCIRLPRKFAKRLFSMTSIGADVIVTGGKGGLQTVNHPTLFHPIAPPILSNVSTPRSVPGRLASYHYFGETKYEVDRLVALERDAEKPLRILVTRRTGRERMLDVQRMLAELGHEPGDIDGYLGPDTGRAIQAFQRENEKAPTGMFTDDLVDALYEAVGRREADGHIYVRRNYIDILDAPVHIRDADEPLGTHMFSANQFGTRAARADWTTVKVDRKSETAPAAVLSRIEIPAPIRLRISKLLTPGSSLVISDAGLGRETGKGTDFIVQPN